LKKGEKMHQGKLLWGVLFVLLSVFISSEVFAQADVNENRQKFMKGNAAASKAIKAAVEAKDFATIEAKAKDLIGNSEKIVGLFPKGSTSGKTKATAAIWDKSDDFANTAKKLGKAAGELAATAKAKDEANLGVKVKALGEACLACHKAFRAEKYAE
jgi:cytochrome c556